MAGPPMFKRAITLAIERLGLEFIAVCLRLGRVPLQKHFQAVARLGEVDVQTEFLTNSGT